MTNSASSYEDELIQELEKIAAAVRFPSRHSFLMGDVNEVKVEPGNNDSQPNPELIECLVDAIYWNAYVRRFDPEALRSSEPVVLEPDATLAAEFAEQEKHVRWDEGWRVESVMPDGSVQARKNDCYRAPVPGEFAFDVPGVRPQPGDPISIRVQRGSTHIQPGFYFEFSDTIPDQFDEFQSVRFYFNSKPDGLNLLYEVRSRLNRFQIPFRFKCPTSLSQFDRLDSGVLYVPRRFADITSRCIAEMLPTIRQELQDDVPLFTKPFYPGVGMAEDPGTMQSFGRSRCELVARGLWSAAFDEPTRAPIERVREQFDAAGISLSQPWLNPGSIDWEPPAMTPGIEQPKFESGSMEQSAFGMADRIGSKICRDAIWSGDACNWLDWSAEEQNGKWIPIHRALGPNSMNTCSGISIYEGSSGIALFLARLYGEGGDSIHRATLLGSVRQITGQLDELEAEANVAFYSGWPGASWAITEIGATLGDEALIRTELTRLEKAAAFEPQLPQTDILLGSAGLITALVDLDGKYGRRFDCSRLLEIAIRHGDFLLSSAVRSEEGWSWETIPVPVHRNLTGYAHGVSGIICALAELSRATGEDRFATAVEEGLRYEQSQFSPESGNWRDYRADAAEANEEAYQFGWCHGAPGIGMARFRLIELGFDSPEIRRDLDVALKTTTRKLEYADSAGQRDFCICHGLAGNAELPLLVSQWSGQEPLRESADRIGQFGINEFEETGKPWPYGLGGTGETPTLFCGMACIGYFYLRLSRPDRVPSILLLRPPHDGSATPA